ncbi:MAG: phosphate signaling complex protein PhoU [Candidatus Bathyarchaeia archaeon]
MSRLIDTGLEQLSTMLYHMGETAYKAVNLSITGYISGLSYYNKVKNLSDTLVVMADELEDNVFEIIARFQPVASDLRILKSCMKIAYDFTRFGRYALDMSQIYERLGGLEKCDDWTKKYINEMCEKVLRMVHISVDSIKLRDIKIARDISELEEQVDSMYFRYLEVLVEKATTTNECRISSVLSVRHLERIADHAAYICESIIYLVTGQKTKLR